MSELSGRIGLSDALAMRIAEGTGPDSTGVDAEILDGFDVFGIPHGGYLTALAAKSALLASSRPDVFTVTVHFLRKAAPGPIRLQVNLIGGSRRFASWQVRAGQDDEVVLAAMVSVGDRSGIEGPTWSDVEAWDPGAEPLSPPAGSAGMPFAVPRIAEQFAERLVLSTVGFAAGRIGDRALVRAVVDVAPTDQLAALVACDVTPPAVWNVLGRQGWVPTVELTAHVRARPGPGSLSVEAETHHVADGFLDENALVRDATGRLIVQSRQLARWTGG